MAGLHWCVPLAMKETQVTECFSICVMSVVPAREKIHHPLLLGSRGMDPRLSLGLFFCRTIGAQTYRIATDPGTTAVLNTHRRRNQSYLQNEEVLLCRCGWCVVFVAKSKPKEIVQQTYSWYSLSFPCATIRRKYPRLFGKLRDESRTQIQLVLLQDDCSQSI